MNLKKVNAKNRTCYYLDDIMEVDESIKVDRILLYEKSYENILVYNILYKRFMDAKPLHIRFNKLDGITNIYYGIRYLELSNSSNLYNKVYYTKYKAIFDRINYLISEKSGIADSINHNQESELIHVIFYL